MESTRRWIMCRISFPVCLLKRHFWLPGETVVNFALSVPWASRRQEALCVSALSLPLFSSFCFSYPHLNYFSHGDIALQTLHRSNDSAWSTYSGQDFELGAWLMPSLSSWCGYVGLDAGTGVQGNRMMAQLTDGTLIQNLGEYFAWSRRRQPPSLTHLWRSR